MTLLKDLGQYFTKNKILQECVCSFIKNNPSVILEPSVGRGDLVSYVAKTMNDICFDMYEIDTTIQMLDCIRREDVCFTDFLTAPITTKYTTIIGNPPYIKTRQGNLFIQFTEKCISLLKKNGELIFIVPSDFFKMTRSHKLLIQMLQEGSFTDIYHPHDEKLFENASVDVIVYRYQKDIFNTNIRYNDDIMNVVNVNGVVSFTPYSQISTNSCIVSNLFNVHVGMVSGKESVFCFESGNVEILIKHKKVKKYILIDKFPTQNNLINDHLLKHKDILLNRKICSFNETNWFKWGALRNINIVNKNYGKRCIYIHTLTRSDTIAFQGKVQYFGGGLILLVPKTTMTNLLMKKIVDYFNSTYFKNQFMFSGRFKIGHRQISNSLLFI